MIFMMKLLDHGMDDDGNHDHVHHDHDEDHNGHDDDDRRHRWRHRHRHRHRRRHRNHHDYLRHRDRYIRKQGSCVRRWACVRTDRRTNKRTVDRHVVESLYCWCPRDLQMNETFWNINFFHTLIYGIWNHVKSIILATSLPEIMDWNERLADWRSSINLASSACSMTIYPT